VFEQPDSRHAVGDDAVFDRGHLDHLALLVADAAVFEDLRGRLVGAGASDGTVVDFGVVRQVGFRDPDGHTLELALAVTGAPPRTFARRGVEPYEPSSPARAAR
jgi:catechol 2,3-dioxygenase-like lactoylglutathione lyase family enzyme